MSWDPYLDLASGVLRNRPGITDAAELARAESELTGLRLVDLEHADLPGHFDLPHLQAFHRHIVGDVHDWAGELRTVREGNGRTQRAYLGRLARAAGYRLRWAGSDPTENVAASRAAHLDGDRTRLRLLLDGVVTAA